MENIATIGESGASNYLKISIMNNGKLALSVSTWTSGGRFDRSVFLDKNQVILLLDAIDKWAEHVNTQEYSDILFDSLKHTIGM